MKFQNISIYGSIHESNEWPKIAKGLVENLIR